MTEQEAIKYLKDANRNNQMVCILPKSDIGKCLVNALEEVQKYRAIGTPEECRAAVEKQIAKKIVRRKATYEDVESELRDFITRKGMIFRCPTCGCCIAVEEMKSCWECGQKLDWSDEK